MTTEKDLEQPSPWATFTTQQVAEFLQLSPPTVRQLGHRGELELLAGLRVHRYTAASVFAYLQGRKK